MYNSSRKTLTKYCNNYNQLGDVKRFIEQIKEKRKKNSNQSYFKGNIPSTTAF